MINHESALRYAQSMTRPGLGERTKRLVKKSWSEKARRDLEWYHLERISGLFRTPRQQWTKKEVLNFGEQIFLIDGGHRLLTESVPAVLFLLCAGPVATLQIRTDLYFD